eukprot:11715165-Prorocentrum_lima.AAC.1
MPEEITAMRRSGIHPKRLPAIWILVTTVIESCHSEVRFPLMLMQDNESCIRTMTTEVSSCRSRHDV